MENLSTVLKELCEEQNINIKQLSKLVNISDSLLYDYINNKITPTTKNIIKLANYFNCSIDFLIGDDGCINNKIFNSKFDKDMFYKRYTQQLKTKNISHYLLCKKLELSRRSLSGWRNGSLPYLETLIKIAKYFDVSIDYLIGRSDD